MKLTKFKVHFIQCPIKFSESVKNKSALLAYLNSTLANSPDIVFFPEICLGSSSSKKWREDFIRSYDELTEELKHISETHAVDFYFSGFESVTRNKIANTAFYISGNTVQTYRKIHLFCFQGEQRLYAAGTQYKPFKTRFGQIAPLICYDIRFPELLRSATFAGADMTWVCAQWPASRRDHWIKLLQARAIENQMHVIACNRTGNKGSLKFSGDSCVISPWGEILYNQNSNVLGGGFTVNMTLQTKIRREYPFLRDARTKHFYFDPK